MMPLEMHPSAQADLLEVIDHCLGVDPELAGEFEKTFREYRQRIQENPGQYDMRHLNLRTACLTPRFQDHAVVYVVNRDRIVVVAISCEKRRPRR